MRSNPSTSILTLPLWVHDIPNQARRVYLQESLDIHRICETQECEQARVIYLLSTVASESNEPEEIERRNRLFQRSESIRKSIQGELYVPSRANELEYDKLVDGQLR